MNGWTGTVLRVNLSDGGIKREPLDTVAARDYLGCRGLGTYYYIKEVREIVDPFSEANKIIFATGPLTGAMGTSTGRFQVVTRSPLTGTIGAANSGGYFGPELKYAGYDLIILEGKSKKPVYLYINNGDVELRDASAVWGLDTHSATDALTAETDPDAKVTCIGPAGERLALLANLINDKHRAPGRGGLGAVMGSKKLKAVVARGTRGVKVADKDAFLKAVKESRELLSANGVTSGGLPAYGTNVLVNILNQTGALPTRNFHEGYFPTADKVGGETLAAERMFRNKGCASCVINCGRVSWSQGKYAATGEGPEYESAWAFGPDCCVDDLDAVNKANFICNEYGLDTIGMGSTIAAAMDLYEMGVIDKETTGGAELRFGDADVMVSMVEAAAKGTGFGEILQHGSYRLGEKFGHTEVSMTSKKQEMPAYDPRGIQGIGLNYATSNRGACHVRGYTISPEVLGLPEKLDPESTAEKPAWVKAFQDLTAAVDSAGMCLFTTFALGAVPIAAQLAAATGVPYTGDEIVKIGERVWNMERLYNIKAGFSKKDDALPERMTGGEPVPGGPMQGRISHVPQMLDVYYEARGWDADGVPSQAKLKELGLEEKLI
ncbi:MAG: aldehyde ferredoxin oxidoreductase family protein [Synergistaceae bacterium]|jgi:aldehyde:ferredoxin oxidoreductase|nr:aldehyde ferredoxin oxidoreductase family protein [Synergistaceae bacterium]